MLRLARSISFIQNFCMITFQVLKYFCETCDEAICRDCAIYEHREHIYVDLREAVKKYRSSITALQDRTKRKIPVLRAAVDEVRDVTHDLHQRVEVVRNTIRDTIQKHIQALEEQERELIGQLEDISNSKGKVRASAVQPRSQGLSSLPPLEERPWERGWALWYELNNNFWNSNYLMAGQLLCS